MLTTKKAKQRGVFKKKDYKSKAILPKNSSDSVEQFQLQPFNLQEVEHNEIQLFILNCQLAAYKEFIPLISEDANFNNISGVTFAIMIVSVYLVIFLSEFFIYLPYLEEFLSFQKEIATSVFFSRFADEKFVFSNKNMFGIDLIFLIVLAAPLFHYLYSPKKELVFKDAIINVFENFLVSEVMEKKNELQKKISFALAEESRRKNGGAWYDFVFNCARYLLKAYIAVFWIAYGVTVCLACLVALCFLSPLAKNFLDSLASSNKTSFFEEIDRTNTESFKKIKVMARPLIESLREFDSIFNLHLKKINIDVFESRSLKYLGVSCGPGFKIKNDRKFEGKYYLDFFKKTVDEFFSLKSFFCPKAGVLVFYEDAERKLGEINSEKIKEAKAFLKKGVDRLIELRKNIDFFYNGYKRNVDEGEISIAFEIGETEEYSINAYASFSMSGEKYYEIDVEDSASFPALKKKVQVENFNEINIVSSSKVEEKVEAKHKPKTTGVANPPSLGCQKNNASSLNNPSNSDVRVSCEVSAGKYVLCVPQFGLFSAFEQGKIEKALQATAARVNPKTNMPKWLKADSLGKQGVKRLAVMNNEGADKEYSLKPNKYKMRLYGKTEGVNAEGQTIINFRDNARFGH